MKNNPCENCGYYYYDEVNGFEMCHYPEDEPHEWSPCEAADEADRIAREEAEWKEEKRRIEEEYREEVDIMTLEEAKTREDYSFDCEEVGHYLEEIRNNKFDCHDEVDGEHIWGVAVLEIGNVDIELNLLSGGTGEDGNDINEVYPCYFICLKGLVDDDDEGDWVSAGYIDNKYPVNVDFTKSNWEKLLEADMFEKLMRIVEEYNFSFDEMNFTPETCDDMLGMF